MVDSDFLIPIESQSTFFIDDSNATCAVVCDFSSVNLSEQTSEIKSSLNFDVSGICIIFLLLLYLHSHFFYLDVISTNEECIAKLNAVAEYCLTTGIISPKSKSIQELLLLMLAEEFSAENQGEWLNSVLNIIILIISYIITHHYRFRPFNYLYVFRCKHQRFIAFLQ